MSKGFLTKHNVMLSVIAVLLFLLLLTDLLFLPLWAWVNGPSDEHGGLAYYTQETYLDFAGGQRFSRILDNLPFVGRGRIVDFYHTDNWMLDTCLYGKMNDVFSVDIYLDEQAYSDATASVVTDSRYISLCNMDYFHLYLFDCEMEKPTDVVLFALCEKEQIVRYIMLTDIPISEKYTAQYGQKLMQISGQDWHELNISADTLGCSSNHIFEMHWPVNYYASQNTHMYQEHGWDYRLDHRFKDPQVQQIGAKVAANYSLVEKYDNISLRDFTWELYNRLTEAGTLQSNLAPKRVYRYNDGYILIEFLTPVFDADGNEITPEDADAVYALISAEDGHIIHFGRAND